MRGITGFTAFMLATLLASPTFAAEDKATALEKIKAEDITRQETIALGNNRFLIFSGTAGEHKQYGYMVDLVKIENGTPRFDPLFMEEYVHELNASRLAYGVAFMAQNYRFDKSDNTLDFTVIDPEDHARYQYKYKLDLDILKLQEVITQAKAECAQEPCKPPAPKVVFNVKDIKDKAAMAPAAAAEKQPEKVEAKAPEKKPFSIVPITNADMQSTNKDTKAQ